LHLSQYRELIKSIVEKHSQLECEDREVETQIAFDIERDRYLMFHVGWRSLFMIGSAITLESNHRIGMVVRSLFSKATLNADEGWVLSLYPTCVREAIALFWVVRSLSVQSSHCQGGNG